MEQLSIDLDALLGEPDEQPAAGLRLTTEQRAAVARRSEPILLSAAAGSGKTSVLVERFVEAVCDDGLRPSAVLAITFTDRAAGELRARVRQRLLDLGRREQARDTEAAFIGTFHGFCTRLLRAHPLPAGLDPDFRILDAGTAKRLALRAHELALSDFLLGAGQGPVDLLAAYGVDPVRETIEALYAELRSRGSRHPRLPVRPADAAAEDDETDARAAVELFDRLLGLFGERYERLKRERAAVDFDDLELIAGELLTASEPIRASWAEGFELLMVDEFQDTNARQLAILRALERDNLFTVGDELQSIYGFRHADVELFRARREELAGSDGALLLSSNFRSRAEILGAVNSVFAQRFDRFTPLLHARDVTETAAPGPAVELLLTSADDEWKTERLAERVSDGLPYAPTSRQAEARLLAQRVREMVDAGEAQPGEVVLLLRATGDIETFERALQLQGLRTLATVGTFWGRQQIADLHSYLRALANPRDEEALYATLASPLVGCSRDGLALIAARRGPERGTVWAALLEICGEGVEELSASDRAVVQRFCAWFAREREGSGGRTLPELLERAIEQSGYVRRVLALDWAERRVANIHKLLRLARSFEAQEGRDLRGFVDHVEHLKRAAPKEPEAPVEGVEPDTVRLMTVHAAKGLEFPVVCVADLGRRPPTPSDRLFVDGNRVGLRLRRPGEGGPGVKALDFEQLRAEQRGREREEEDRVFYVAMTRAKEHLLLSGVVDFSAWPEGKEGVAPIVWLGPALCPELPKLGGQGPGTYALTTRPGGPEVRVTLSDPASYGSILRELPQLRAEQAPDAADLAGRPAETIPAPAVLAEASPALPATLSYTSLTLLERCGYRYYLERVLRMPEERRVPAEPRGAGLAPRDRGTLIHRLLETSDFGRAAAPDGARVAAVAAELKIELAAGEEQEIAALLAVALASPLAARLRAARRRHPEHPFAFGLGETAPLVTGVIDLLCEEPGGALLVVDYKSDRLEPVVEVEALVERDYGVQRLLYALAVLREGAFVVEVAHWFLERPDEPAVARYTLAERPMLEEELAKRLAEDWAEPYAVSPRPHRGLCLTCPGRGGMCSWNEEATMREDPDESLAPGQ